MLKYNFRTRVYYKDVDQMGVVYYSRYFEYFEAARTELLRLADLDVPSIESQGFFLPVISSHCDYRESARFDDIIIIETVIPNLPKARLRINYEAHSKDGKNHFVSGYTEHCFINKVGKPVRTPQFFLQKLREYFHE